MAGNLNVKNALGKTVTLQNPDTNNSDIIIDGSQIVTKSGSVTDNSVPRFDGTTGKVQNSNVIIDDNGNVGIGTNSPIFKIDVLGDSGNGIKYSNGTISVVNGVGSTTGQVGTLSNHNLELLVGSTAKAVIDTNGNVGINGTPVSGYKLDIFGPSASSPATTSNRLSLRELGGVSSLNFTAANEGGTLVERIYSSTNLALGAGAVERIRIDSSGNLLLKSGTGALGYGTGAGGVVTQLTSKSTPVTLNKPSGKIITSNSTLGAGETAAFYFYNNVFTSINDILHTQLINNTNAGLYNIWATNNGAGFGFVIFIKNISNVSLSDTLEINFSLIKGAIS